MKAKIGFTIICHLFLSMALFASAPVKSSITSPFRLGDESFSTVHTLKIISPTGDQIIIEDDSAWSVFPVDGTVLRWHIIDSLKFEPNITEKTKDTSYQFKITNTTRNESIFANVIHPAKQNNPFTFAVRLIDRKENTLMLQRLTSPYDRLYWKVADVDKDKIANWQINHYILIADSVEPSPVFTISWLKTAQDDTTYILINEITNSYVNVKKLY